MPRVRGTRLVVYCSEEQKEEAERRAREAGFDSPANHIRSGFYGWPTEQRGTRKDLEEKASKQGQRKDLTKKKPKG